jgi:hypothetical protein
MVSFHGDPDIKEKYLSRVRRHRELDNIIQGTGWTGFKGCAIGCTLETYNHKRYPIELGLPEWLARLEDHIFEALPLEDSKKWPEQFLSVVPVGIPETSFAVIRDQFQIFWLERQISQINNDAYPDIVAAIQGTIALLHRGAAGDEPDAAAWSAAESAAWSAAESAAESAAWSAAESAAWSAARSAARSAAESAAWSAAESAAWSAARSAAWSAARSAAWSVARSAAESEARAKRDWLLSALSTLS